MAAEVRVIGPGTPGGSTGGGGGGGGATLTLTMAPPGGTLAVNATQQLVLTLRDDQGVPIPIGTVTWSTSNSAIIAVDQTGLVRGVGLGTGVITASTSGAAATATFTIVATPVASVSVAPATATIQLGATSQFSAVVRDAGGNALSGRVVTWSSSNAAVITVDATGQARANGTGTATVTASSEGRSGTSAVTVQNVPVATVQVVPGNDTVQIGQQTQLVATPRDGSGNALSGRVITWSSSAPTIARVSGNGLIDGLAQGTATITATSEGRTGTATITVIRVPVATVVVVPQAVTVLAGGTTQFSGTPRDVNGNGLTGRTVVWSTANGAVATVSPTGVVSGVAAGSVLISATCEGIVGSAFVTVTLAPATLVSVTIAPQTVALLSGQTQQYSLTGTLSDASTIPVSGTFTATGGTVNGAGLYTAPDLTGAFLVIGTATSSSLRDTATANVTRPAVATVQLSPTSGTVDVGRTLGFTATMRDGTGNVLTNRVVTWASSNTTAATVNASGLVTGRAVGSTTITATSEGQSASASVTVQLTPVASVQVTPSSASLGIGLTLPLTASCRDANGNVLTGRTVAWSSSAPTVATVGASTGVVTALVVGNATITANCEGPTASAAISVTIVTASADYPNEPAGAIVLMDYDTDFGTPGNPPWGYMSGTGNLSTVTDVTAPVNPSKVGRVRFSAGCCDGTGPARLETYSGSGRGTPPSNWTRWYVSDWIKFDPAWKPHAGVQKLFEFYWSSGGDKWLLVKADNNNGGNFPLIPRLHAEFSGTNPYYMPSAENEIILPGVWYQYEVIVHRTGRVQFWIRPQGQPPITLFDGTMTGSGSVGAGFLFWWWGYGGLGAYPGPTAYIYHNHIRVSYTP